MPSLIQPLLRTMTPACHPPHLTPVLFKSHSQQLPSSRCIESAHPLQCDSRFLAGGASDTALGLLASDFWSFPELVLSLFDYALMMRRSPEGKEVHLRGNCQNFLVSGVKDLAEVPTASDF